MARKYHQGRYRPVHPEKYIGDREQIIFRSGWERRFLNWCDLNPSVIKYNSEEIVIPYWSEFDQKMRRYFVDFIIQIRKADGNLETLLVEIKPNSQTKKPEKKGRKKMETYLSEMATWQVNQDKWKAAEIWANKNGMKFCILDEYALGIKKR